MKKQYFHVIFKNVKQLFRSQIVSSSLSSSSSSLISSHIPVMKSEIIEYTQPKSGQVYLDMTFGTGGHANEILKHASNDLICYFLDRDPTSLHYMKSLQAQYSSLNHKIYPFIGRFSDLPQLLRNNDNNIDLMKYQSIDLILMDLGVSSPQLDIESRGFSFRHNSPLDMRMDQDQFVKKDTPTAAHVVNTLTTEELSNIFSIYGEEHYSKRIANAIVDYRNDNGPIQSTKQLANLIRHVVPMSRDNIGSIDPATRVFQAIRIFVNDELNELCIGLELAEFLLKPGGHLAVLSFHSLEDRLVKWLVNHNCEHLTLSKYLSQRSMNFLRTTANERREYSDDFNSEHDREVVF
ncbi:putative methyltransferase-like protein 15 [Schistosoma japonicum]|nr:putative methyltransferase-like protein 15 [Schistosoma japonicum]